MQSRSSEQDDCCYFDRWLSYFNVQDILDLSRMRYELLKKQTGEGCHTQLVEEIDKDLQRLFPRGHVHFFQNDCYLGYLRNILKVWCAQNEDVSYRQGMHDLVAVLLYAFLKQAGKTTVETDFGPATLRSSTDENVLVVDLEEATGFIQGDSVKPPNAAALESEFPNLEADVFILFDALMNYMKPLYEVNETPPRKTAPEKAISGGDNNSTVVYSRSGTLPAVDATEDKSTLQMLCQLIQHDLLRRHDPELSHHLQRMDVLPETYALRWTRLLFAREFDLDDVLVLWDTIFAHLEEENDTNFGTSLNAGPPHLRYVAIALLISKSSELKKSDNTNCLKMLMQGESSVDSVEDIVTLSRQLQNPLTEEQNRPGIKVVEFGPGPLGVVLTQAGEPYDGYLAVREFSEFKGSDVSATGQAESCGKIAVGDVVVSINGVSVREITTDEIKRHIQCVGRPLFVGFKRISDAERVDFEARQVESATTAGQVANHRQQQYLVDQYMPLKLSGEDCFANTSATMHAGTWAADGNWMSTCVTGKLYVTNYRFMFHENNFESVQWQIPVLSIHSIEAKDIGLDYSGTSSVKNSSTTSREYRLVIKGKDTQTVRFSFSNFAEYHRVFNCMNALAYPQNLLQAFCFSYAPYLSGGESCGIFDIRTEYRRCGFLDYPEYFRCIDQNYSLCESYPKHLVVPQKISDLELQQVALFRHRQRIPVATWFHRPTGAVMSRSSQPLVGLKSTRCSEDERMITALCTDSYDVQRAAETITSSSYVIVDARSQLASVGNKAMGKGTELSANYRGSAVVFMNVDNIHSIRQSFNNVAKIFQNQDRSGKPEESGGSFTSKIESSGWLKHIRLILKASVEIARKIERGKSVLTHCSDGWDRTSQMVATAELMLDSFYRTLEGFLILIEKDWCSFGHQFGTRSGHGRSDISNEQRSPIFFCWLDIVYQCISQHPTAFEFNENLLIALADHVHSCKYVTLMFDTEKVRNDYGDKKRPASLRDYVLMNQELFRNDAYIPVENSSVYPSHLSKNVRLWMGYFGRWDDSLIPQVPSRQFY